MEDSEPKTRRHFLPSHFLFYHGVSGNGSQLPCFFTFNHVTISSLVPTSHQPESFPPPSLLFCSYVEPLPPPLCISHVEVETGHAMGMSFCVVHGVEMDFYAVHAAEMDFYAVHTMGMDSYVVHATEMNFYVVHAMGMNFYIVHAMGMDSYVVRDTQRLEVANSLLSAEIRASSNHPCLQEKVGSGGVGIILPQVEGNALAPSLCLS
ncbi:uncharacterized protein LOC113946268 [Corapipo altera]|uniref:uncharacterized protein LOC113946268 n=1 Tax=Corapipo altera TaxID=415028 RepID=UPI000FD64443|nr:uncharacterized protein LOC113946268 [Corapipo altera]XP_027497124.1 uncharacterized protein LOC113946268 [Corapipo altera]